MLINGLLNGKLGVKAPLFGGPMNIYMKNLLVIFSFGLSGPLMAAAAPKPQVPVVQSIDQKQTMENPEQALEKLAQSLGLTFKKNIFSKDEEVKVDMHLKDPQGKQYAYLRGAIDQPVKGVACIDLLEVDLDFRKKGIGLLLCKAFCSVCREAGCKQITFLASSFGSDPIPDSLLVNFYTKLGANIIEHEDYGVRMTFILP